MDRERDQGEGFIKTVMGVAVVGAFAVGALYVADKMHWIDINLPTEVDLGSDPGIVNAGVDKNSYTEEADMNVTCLKRVSVGVDVEGFKNGPVGDGVLKKKIFGDFLLCGDNNEVEANAIETIDPITHRVTQVDVVLSGLKPLQARVDHNDRRNCIDGNVGDTMQVIGEKLKEYDEKVAKGDKPGCDDGFEVTQFMGSESLADIKDFGYAAAQIAMTLDANPRGIIAEADNILVEQVKTQLAQKERYTNAVINVSVERPTDMQDLQSRLDAANAQDFGMFSKTSVGEDDKGPYFYAVANDGGHVTIHLGGYASLDVDQLIVSDPVPTASEGS